MPNYRRSGLEDMNSGKGGGKNGRKGPSSAIVAMGSEDIEFKPRNENEGGLFFGDADYRASVKAKERKKAPSRIVEPRCDTCNHPYRDFIETMLVRGMTYKGIADRVTPELDRRSISNHYKNHMDLQDAALRSILESEAKIQGQNFEEGVQDAITKRGVLEVALRKGFEDIQMGVTTVEPRDLIQIAKLLADLDSHAYQVGLDELRTQVQLFIQAIKDVCDRDMQGAIAERVKVLRSRENIDAEIERAMVPPVAIEAGVEEAEVVEVG